MNLAGLLELGKLAYAVVRKLVAFDPGPKPKPPPPPAPVLPAHARHKGRIVPAGRDGIVMCTACGRSGTYPELGNIVCAPQEDP